MYRRVLEIKIQVLFPQALKDLGTRDPIVMPIHELAPGFLADKAWAKQRADIFLKSETINDALSSAAQELLVRGEADKLNAAITLAQATGELGGRKEQERYCDAVAMFYAMFKHIGDMGFVLTSIAYSAQTHNILTYTHDRWLLYFLTHAYEKGKEPWPALPLSIIFGRNPSAAGAHKTALGYEIPPDLLEAATGQIDRWKKVAKEINEQRKNLPSKLKELNNILKEIRKLDIPMTQGSVSRRSRRTIVAFPTWLKEQVETNINSKVNKINLVINSINEVVDITNRNLTPPLPRVQGIEEKSIGTPQAFQEAKDQLKEEVKQLNDNIKLIFSFLGEEVKKLKKKKELLLKKKTDYEVQLIEYAELVSDVEVSDLPHSLSQLQSSMLTKDADTEGDTVMRDSAARDRLVSAEQALGSAVTKSASHTLSALQNNIVLASSAVPAAAAAAATAAAASAASAPPTAAPVASAVPAAAAEAAEAAEAAASAVSAAAAEEDHVLPLGQPTKGTKRSADRGPVGERPSKSRRTSGGGKRHKKARKNTRKRHKKARKNTRKRHKKIRKNTRKKSAYHRR